MSLHGSVNLIMYCMDGQGVKQQAGQAAHKSLSRVMLLVPYLSALVPEILLCCSRRLYRALDAPSTPRSIAARSSKYRK